MNTACPHCHAVFRIEQEILARADGRVRCGECNHVFDARSHLQTELPFAADSGEDDVSTGASGVLLSDLENAAARRSSRRSSHRALWGWGLANTLLVVVLCSQLLLVQRAAFAQNPTMRPLVTHLCAIAGCEVAPRHAPGRIQLLQRQVYSHPNIDHALIIEARFVSKADFAQPYPTLTVSLGDARGQPVARRNFQPATYRASDAATRMTPGKPVDITLKVADPGNRVRTFELDFF